MAVLDKNKVKYERSKILAKSFDNMLQKIDDQSASCVLNENAYKAKKKEASQKATLPTI